MTSRTTLRRLVLTTLTALCAGLSVPAVAQTYPSRQIRIIVPFAPGGIADSFGRVIGQKLSEAWGQPVVIENRTGAGGNLGADVVAKSPPDGYTLVMGNIGTHAVNPALFASMPFDPVKDFTPIALVIEAEGILVIHPESKANSVGDLIALARAEPGKLTFGSGGRGTTSHLAGELFNAMANVKVVHVPYKGNVPAITDLIGNQITMAFATMPTALPYVRNGKLRAIAVIGSNRSPAVPDLPTVAEAGLPGFEANNWIGLFGPAGMPAEVVARLNAAVMQIMRTPDVQKRLETEGARFSPNTPEQFATFVRGESVKWTKTLKEAGTRPE